MKKLWKRIVAFVLVVGMVLTTNGIAGLTPVEAADNLSENGFTLVCTVPEFIDTDGKGIKFLVQGSGSFDSITYSDECPGVQPSNGRITQLSQEVQLTNASAGNHVLKVVIVVGTNVTTLEKDYTLKKPLSYEKVKFAGYDTDSNISYPYTGAVIKPMFMEKTAGGPLVEGTDYDTISYKKSPINTVQDPVEKGSYKGTATAAANGFYIGDTEGSFSIKEADFKNNDEKVLYGNIVYDNVTYAPTVTNLSATSVANMGVKVQATATGATPTTGTDPFTYEIPAMSGSNVNYTSALKKLSANGVAADSVTATSGDYLAVEVTGTNNCTGKTSAPIALNLANATVTGKSTTSGSTATVTGTYSPDGDFFKDSNADDGIKTVTVPNNYTGVTDNSGATVSGGTFGVPTEWLKIEPEITENIKIGTNNATISAVNEEAAKYYSGSTTIEYTLNARDMSSIQGLAENSTDKAVIIVPPQEKTTVASGITGVTIKDTVNGQTRTLVQGEDFNVTGINVQGNQYSLTLTGKSLSLYTGTVTTGQIFEFGTTIGNADITAMVDAKDRYCGELELTSPEPDADPAPAPSGLRTGKPYRTSDVSDTTLHASYTGEYIQPEISLTGDAFKDEDVVKIAGDFGENTFYYRKASSPGTDDNVIENDIPKSAEYRVTYSNNLEPSSSTSKAKITVEGVNNYAGTRVIEFTIDKMQLPSSTVVNEFQLVCGEKNEIFEHLYNGWEMELTAEVLNANGFKLQRTFLKKDGSKDTEIVKGARGGVAVLTVKNNQDAIANPQADFYLQHGSTGANAQAKAVLKIGLVNSTLNGHYFATAGVVYYKIAPRLIQEVAGKEEGSEPNITYTTNWKGKASNHEYAYTGDEITGDMILDMDSFKVNLIEGNSSDQANPLLFEGEDFTISAYEIDAEESVKNDRIKKNTDVGSTVRGGRTITGFSTVDYYDSRYNGSTTRGPRIVIQGTGNYTGKLYYYFTITPKALLPQNVTIADVPYMASAITPDDLKSRTIVTDGVKPISEENYSVALNSANPAPVAVGKAYQADIIGTEGGAYAGEKVTVPFNIKYNLAPGSTSTDSTEDGDSSSGSGSTTTTSRSQGIVFIAIDRTNLYKLADGRAYRRATDQDTEDCIKNNDGAWVDKDNNVVVDADYYYVKEPIAKVETDGTITIPMGTTYGYTGNEILPEITTFRYFNTRGRDEINELPSKDTDYTVKYGANTLQTQGGSITITAVNTSNYMGEIRLTFDIGTSTLSAGDVEFVGTNTDTTDHYSFTGSQIRPKVRVEKNGSAFVEGTHYELRYGTNVNVSANGVPTDPYVEMSYDRNGNAVFGSGQSPANFVDIVFTDPNVEIPETINGETDGSKTPGRVNSKTIRKYFKIDPVSLDSPDITVDVQPEEYDGTAKPPRMTLVLKTEGYGAYTLKSGDDYATTTNPASFTDVKVDTQGNAVRNIFTISAGTSLVDEVPVSTSQNFTGSRDAEFKIYYDLSKTTIEWYKKGEPVTLKESEWMQFPYSPKADAEGRFIGVVPEGLTDKTYITDAGTVNEKKNTGFIVWAKKPTSESSSDGVAVPENAYTVTVKNNDHLSTSTSRAEMTITANEDVGLAKNTQIASFSVIRNNLTEGKDTWGDNMPEVEYDFEEVTFDNAIKTPAVTISYDGTPLRNQTDYTLVYGTDSTNARFRIDATAEKSEDEKPYVTITAAGGSNSLYSTTKTETDVDGNTTTTTSIRKTFEILQKPLDPEDIEFIDFVNVITIENAEANGQLLTEKEITDMYTYRGDDKPYVTFNPATPLITDGKYYVQSNKALFRLEDKTVASSSAYQLIGGRDYTIDLLTGSTNSNNYKYEFIPKGNYTGNAITKPFAAKLAFIEWLGETDAQGNPDKTGKVTVEVGGSGGLASQMVNGIPQKDLGDVPFANIATVVKNTQYALTYERNTGLTQGRDYNVTYNRDGFIYPGSMTVYFTPTPESRYNQEQDITKTFGVIGSLADKKQVDIIYADDPIWTDDGPLAETFVVNWIAKDSNGEVITTQKVPINDNWYKITKRTYVNGTKVLKTIETPVTGAQSVFSTNTFGRFAAAPRAADEIPTEVIVEVTSTGVSKYCTGTGTYRIPFASGVQEPDNPDDPSDTRINLSSAQIELSQTDFTYDGQQHRPVVTVSVVNGEGTSVGLTEGTDYTITWPSDLISAGTKTLTITANPASTKYRGSQSISYMINEQVTIDLSEADVTVWPNVFNANGREQKPDEVIVTINGVELIEGTDYRILWPSDLSSVGTKELMIRPVNTLKYRGSKTAYYTIRPEGATDAQDIGKASVTFSPTTFTADGTDKKPTSFTVITQDGKTLTQGTDFTVGWPDGDNYKTAGEKHFTIIGTNNPYWGTQTVSYTVGAPVSKTNLSTADVTLDPSSFVEDGSEHKPTTITVRVGSTVLTEGTDYTVDWPSADYTTNGIKQVRIIAKSDSALYEGTKDVNFTINPKDNGEDNNKDKTDISGGTLEIATTHYKYDGLEKRPSISKVVVDGRTLDIGVDYTVEYYNNTDIGTGVVVVTGIGNYYGTLMTTFVISRTGAGIVDPDDPDDVIDFNAVNAVSISGVANSYIYTGNDIEPKPGVTTNARRTLEEGVDYEVIYMNNRNVGTAAVVVAAKGSRYTGALTTYYSIWKKTINQCSISMSSKDRPYTGKPRTPAVTVKDGSRTLVAGTDYSVTYKNNTKIGLATAVVQGEGNYKDNKNISFRIVTGKVENVKNTSSKKKAVTLKWNKVTKATGYEIYTSDRKTKVATVKNATTVQVKGLKPGVQYKYRVRAFVKQDGEKVYGEFSDAVVTATKPKKVKAKASAATARTVRLTWNKVKGSGYVVYRATSSNGKYKKLKAVTSAATLSYTDTSVVSGRTYFYKIRAYRKASGKKVFGAYSTPVGVVAR